MQNTDNKNKEKSPEIKSGSDCTGSDNDADKTGTDKNADKTEITQTPKKVGADKFDKPKREVDPDKTGIDTDADKTKKEK